VTALNVSPSARLHHALRASYCGDVDMLLGEFQLSFLLFLLLSAAAGLDHWKALLHLVRQQNSCSPCRSPAAPQVAHCDKASPSWLRLAQCVAETLIEQLRFAEQDLFVDEELSGNFLSPALAALVRSASMQRVSEALRRVADQLCEVADSRFSLGLARAVDEAEEEEDAPAVVELLEQQSEELGEVNGTVEAQGAAPAQLERMPWMKCR